jgi:hypothetical protein
MDWDISTLEPFEQADVSAISFGLIQRVVSHFDVASSVVHYTLLDQLNHFFVEVAIE